MVALGLFYCYNEAVVRASHPSFAPLALPLGPIRRHRPFRHCPFRHCPIRFCDCCCNAPQAKLPWVRWHRFEKWFWEKVRLKWLPAASAATVLAQQYAKDLSSDMRGAPGRLLKDAWNAPGRFMQRVRLPHVLPHALWQATGTVDMHATMRGAQQWMHASTSWKKDPWRLHEAGMGQPEPVWRACRKMSWRRR